MISKMELSSLDIGYSNSAPILMGIDAELIAGQMVALIGRNGSGKSTLLRTMAGILPPLVGTVNGERPAIVLTAMPELRNTTVRQMVAYGRLQYTGFVGRLLTTDYDAADRAIDQLGIHKLVPRLFCDLSDGEKQKVMIARALAQDTTTLLLDEPSAFLDYPSRLLLMQQLRALAQHEGKAILVSTHDIELAMQYASELWVIRDGKLITGIDPKTFNPQSLL